MKKLLSAVAIALAISGTAYGQTTTFHDAAGRVTGRARTNIDGSTTFYDAAGRVQTLPCQSGLPGGLRRPSRLPVTAITAGSP